MWKKATKTVLNMFIIIGSLITLGGTILSGFTTFLLWDGYAALLNNPKLEETAIILAIITGIIFFIIGSSYTFMGATSIGLKLEVAEDIEQIRINTTHIENNKIQQENLDINKYIYPYQ